MTKTPNYVFDTDDELYHWGILGQRWGHRRFQNEDGSLTAEGRERYGVSEARSKSDAQKAKARISYNTQKYKADLKSKAAKEKVSRSANEERQRIRENSKNIRLARKEQAKFDKLNKKEEMKLERQGRPMNMRTGKTKNMSDEDLQKAIDRLKLQAEYNKAYAIATSPNSALAKADRFFEGPTGKLVGEIAKQTIPTIANTALTKVLETKLKYANKEDRDKMAADIDKVKSDAEKNRAEVESKRLVGETAKAKIERENAKAKSELADAELKRKIDESNQRANLWKISEENKRWANESQAKINRENAESAAKIKNERSKQAAESYVSVSKARTESKDAATDRRIKEAEAFGGVKYLTTPDGREAVTKGSLAYKDEKDWWEAYERRRKLGLL